MRYILIAFLLTTAALSFGQTNISNDTLHWNSSRLLTWEDFKGESLEGIGLNGEVFCMNMANFERPNRFQKTKFKVIAIFDRTKSWINADQKSPNGLLYFQVIFNIYEVHARELRQDLATSTFGADPTPLFQEKYNQTMTNLTTEFNLFRKETRMGQDVDAVKTWKAKVDEELNALDEFKN